MIDDDMVRAIDAALRVCGDEIAKAAAANGDTQVATLASGRRALSEMFADGYLALDARLGLPTIAPSAGCCDGSMPRWSRATTRWVRRGAFEPLKDAAA